MCCVICDEYKPWGFGRVCPCCTDDSETKYETVECVCCEGLGFFPVKNGRYLSASEYRKLSYYEKAMVDEDKCLECGGKGEVEKEIN